jgi:hypothetical protein
LSSRRRTPDLFSAQHALDLAADEYAAKHPAAAYYFYRNITKRALETVGSQIFLQFPRIAVSNTY